MKKVETKISYFKIRFAFFHTSFSIYLGKPGIPLVELYIEPHARGNGFGKLMLSYLGDITRQRDCERLEWWCHDWNKTAIERYVNWGANMVDHIRVYRMVDKNLETFSKEYNIKNL